MFSSTTNSTNPTIAFKVYHGDDIRRFSLEAESLTARKELVQPIRRLFRLGAGRLRTTYRDPDGDWIVFSSDMEFVEMMRVVLPSRSTNEGASNTDNVVIFVRVERAAGDAVAQPAAVERSAAAPRKAATEGTTPSSTATAGRPRGGNGGGNRREKSSLVAEFVRHGPGLPNEASVTPGIHTKNWLVRNDGTAPWRNVVLRFVGGMGCTPVDVQPVPATVKPGEEVTVTARFAVPNQIGTYGARYKLVDEDACRFGPPLRARVRVVEKGSTTTGTDPVIYAPDCDLPPADTPAASPFVKLVLPVMSQLWGDYHWMGHMMIHVIAACAFRPKRARKRLQQIAAEFKGAVPAEFTTQVADVTAFVLGSETSLLYQNLVFGSQVDEATRVQQYAGLGRRTVKQLLKAHAPAMSGEGEWEKEDGTWTRVEPSLEMPE